MPKGRKKLLTINTDEANDVVERNRSFNISTTGTFVLDKEGVRINAQGMKVIQGKEYAETGGKTLMTNFADFDMLEHVGHGGGGVVNKALHTPTKEIVAIKTINVNRRSPSRSGYQQPRILHPFSPVALPGQAERKSHKGLGVFV